MKVKIATVQPKSFTGNQEHQNVEAALAYIDQAANQGAQFVSFPELYPGPFHPSQSYDTSALYAKAKERSIYIVRGMKEEVDGGYNICAELISPSGESVGIYRRTTPSGPYVYKDIPIWDFDYVQADNLPVFDTEFGKVGVLICSEVYVPELARILTLKGAKIIFYPSGGYLNELLPTWRVMVQARAIENLIYTAATQSLYGVEDGIGMIAGPEGILTENIGEAVLVAEIDFERQQWLRDQDEKIEMPKRYKVVPGLLRWQNPEMYRENPLNC